MNGAVIVAQARTYVGVPWRHMGRNRAGVDCVGLITCVAYDLGVTDYDTRTYPRTTSQEEMLAPFHAFADIIRPADLRPGDGVVFVTGGRGHCGIFTGDTVIHAYVQAGKVVEDAWSVWRKHSDPTIKLIAAFRVRHG